MEPIVVASPIAASPPVDVLTDLLSEPSNALVVAATMALLSTLFQVLPVRIVEHPIAVRLRPIFPLLVASALVQIPGLSPADVSTSSRALLGLILGASGGQLYKTWTQGVLGRDSRLPPPKPKDVEP